MGINLLILFAFVCMTVVANLYSVCPVCTVAVGAGVGVSRWFGVHDAIIGIWIGGFLLALSWWMNSFLRAHGYTFIGYRLFIPIFMYFTAWASVWCSCGFGLCTLAGISCLTMGVLIGSVIFALGTILSCILKVINNGQVFFYFQKVVIPFVLLLLASILVYVLV